MNKYDSLFDIGLDSIDNQQEFILFLALKVYFLHRPILMATIYRLYFSLIAQNAHFNPFKC